MKSYFIALAMVVISVMSLRAQPAVFTYQGVLDNGTTAVTGAYDFRFKIYDAGSLVFAGPVTNAPVGVTNGLFTVALDFHTNVFDGSARSLEIGVRTNLDTNAYTVLSPRQALTSVPYALQAINASNAVTLTSPLQTTNLSGTIPNSLLSPYVAVLTNSVVFSNSVTATNFIGNGYGLSNVPAASLTGTLPDIRLSTNVAMLTATNAMFSSNVTAVMFTGAGHGLTNVPGAFFWVTVTNNNTLAQPNIGYICTNDVNPVTVQLPLSLSIGDTFRVAGVGAAGWVIAQTNGQTILAGNLSTLIGQNWATSGPSASWTAVASSANGAKLVATVSGGRIYTNSGSTWAASSASSLTWSSVASSADGTKLVAVVGNNVSQTGQIYTSTNTGSTWTARDSARQWLSVASSADGTRLIAAAYGSGSTPGAYTSANSGVTWTLQVGATYCSAVASSANGTNLMAAFSSGTSQGIWTSANAGLAGSWVQRTNIGNWVAVASSSDGTRLAAAVGGGQIYVSSDAGVTWFPSSPSQPWTSIASSADGSRLVGVTSSGLIYTSSDSGGTWVLRNAPALNWTGVASSADGSKLVAVSSGGKIYLSSQGNTTVGTGGYLAGTQQSTIELEYVGNSVFIPLSHEGTILAY